MALCIYYYFPAGYHDQGLFCNSWEEGDYWGQILDDIYRTGASTGLIRKRKFRPRAIDIMKVKLACAHSVRLPGIVLLFMTFTLFFWAPESESLGVSSDLMVECQSWTRMCFMSLHWMERRVEMQSMSSAPCAKLRIIARTNCERYSCLFHNDLSSCIETCNSLMCDVHCRRQG